MNWKKILLITCDVIIAAYLVLAVTALNRPKDEDMVCSDVRVSIEKDIVPGFLTPREVTELLSRQHLNPIGHPMSDVNIRQIEEALQTNTLIEQAECYKTHSGHVCISIRQRIPVIRVMAANGDDYYVDSQGRPMEPSVYHSNLIVATGHISRAYAGRVLARLGNLILADNFWKNQIEQLNVLPDGSVELVPRVGEHVAYLGQPVGVTRKLERLRKFYRYGLNEAGWNKYSRISVEFDNQIVCKRK